MPPARSRSPKIGAVYVLGQTQSADFPTTPDAVQRNFGGPRRDVFILKLDGNGKIVYSTLLGGTKNDEPSGFAVADDGTVYVSGVTMSSDFPGVRARYGPGGSPDGFIARLRPGDPASLQTVLVGGKGREQVTSLALDRSGNLFAAGYTFSDDFPVKQALQPRLAGEGDGFLLKLRLSDWSLLFSTYLGGSKLDAVSGVAVDAAGNPVVNGVTASEDLATTKGAFQPKRRGSVDAFVTKLDRDGKRFLWSTYYGGSKENADQYEGGSLAIDPQGRVWFDGATSSPDLPLRHPDQATYGGGDFDGFLAALPPTAPGSIYGSYAGGTGHDILEGLALGKQRVYGSGISSSPLPGYGGGPYDAILFGPVLIPAAK